ncbi:MAG TPA: hypothetical protein VH969_20665 [Actinophytocola sp.]|jgi:hypothetical protein|uniref:Rv1733c family protein n=1 Tax=Actinophytocola sp. TaxID=1872138 RepID=UPI002F955CBA
MTHTSSSLFRRWGRLIWPFHNPLARGTDRMESAAMIVVLLAALLLVPVMLVIGSLVRADLLDSSERDANNRHEAVAVLVEDAPVSSTGGYVAVVAGKSYVMARWTRPDGRTATAPVLASDGLKAGAKVDIWLDRSGRLADKPLSPTDADAGGALVALTGWLTAMVMLALTFTGLHLLLERCRRRAWDREWADVEPGWNNNRR